MWCSVSLIKSFNFFFVGKNSQHTNYYFVSNLSKKGPVLLFRYWCFGSDGPLTMSLIVGNETHQSAVAQTGLLRDYESKTRFFGEVWVFAVFDTHISFVTSKRKRECNKLIVFVTLQTESVGDVCLFLLILISRDVWVTQTLIQRHKEASGRHFLSSRLFFSPRCVT